MQPVAENGPRNDTKFLEEKFVFFSAISWIVCSPFELGPPPKILLVRIPAVMILLHLRGLLTLE
jgi:hypothetical protein